MQSPVYPASRGHTYPPECPGRKAHSGDLKFPIYNVESHHNFQDKAPAHFKVKNLQGPSYDIDRRHHFTKETTIHEKVKNLVGPAYDVTGGSGHKYPAEGKIEVPGVGVPKDIRFPVMDVDHSSHYKPTAEPHHDVTELRAPKLAVPRQHQFTGIELESEFDKNAAIAPRELVGPVYDTEASNNYREVVKHQEAVKGLQGPVYDSERNHHFQAQGKNLDKANELKGPVYGLEENKHHFQAQAKKAEELKKLVGPVFDIARDSKYVPDEARKPGELAQTGPVYRGVDNHNKYHPQAEKVQSDPGMYGPKLPVESANHYIPQAGPKVETERVMAAPHFRGVGIEHNNNFQPDLVQKPGDPIMVGPKLPNIDYSHHYGPVPPKVDDPYKNFS